ncbi:unnamed protein product [Microthlaspi erraticum]|uniref:RRM domain-containing protein n=1 Tax=Microthlaspi erraticum TaxID=1685480 RepID=A0A6D2I6H5_9BRAS|nr:unnamed protein product [Microthlaspi erraticum]
MVNVHHLAGHTAKFKELSRGLWGWHCKSSSTAKNDCALRCLSPVCYELTYESDPLKEKPKKIWLRAKSTSIVSTKWRWNHVSCLSVGFLGRPVERSSRCYFQNYGEVLQVVIMKDRVTGRARGFGFIT